MNIEDGVEVYAGIPIITYHLEDGVVELHRVVKPDSLVVRPNLVTESDVYQIAMFCAGLMDSWDITNDSY